VISPVRTTDRPRTNSLHCAVEFQALPSRIGQIRRILTAQLRYWRVPQLIDAVSLGITELLSNVHRHGTADKRCTVELVLLGDRLTVSVHDLDPELPRVRPPARFATSGRGLALVAAVSDDWGMRMRADGRGKVVWFALPSGPARPVCAADGPSVAAGPGPAAEPSPAPVPADR
jgi:anti-sigma regulatory factor (Ser/Thr protein kinase)